MEGYEERAEGEGMMWQMAFYICLFIFGYVRFVFFGDELRGRVTYDHVMKVGWGISSFDFVCGSRGRFVHSCAVTERKISSHLPPHLTKRNETSFTRKMGLQRRGGGETRDKSPLSASETLPSKEV